MAGLADFGYLYGAANQGSSAAFANRLPVDPNQPKPDAFAQDFGTNLTSLATLEQNQRALASARNLQNQQAFDLSQQPILPDINTPVVTVAPLPADKLVSPILGATTSTAINPAEPLVYINVPGPQGSYLATPQSQAAGLRGQILTDQQAAEANQLRAQAEQQAALQAAGLTYPTSRTNEAADSQRGIVFGKKVTIGGKGGAFSTFQPAPPEPEVLVNGEPISKSAYEKLAGASQTMAKVLSVTDPAQMPEGAKVIIKAARKAGVDPKIALAVGVMESNLNTETGDSPVGAKGVMQVMPGTYEATRLKFLKSSDPALRALAASLPVATYGTKGANNKITYSWDTKVALTADQQAAAGVLYLKDLQQSYPNRPANIIFAMYHSGPGYSSYDEGIVPGVADFGIDKNGKPYGMYTKDYNTVGIGLYNQLAQGGFKDTAAGLKTDTAAAAAPAQDTAQGTAQGTTQGTTAAPVVSSTGTNIPQKLDPVSVVINKPPAELEANQKNLLANRQSMVDEYTQTNELSKRYAQEAEARLRGEASIKEAQLRRELESARIGGKSDVYTQKTGELTALYTKLNNDLNDIAKKYEDRLLGANKAVTAALQAHDAGLWGAAIDNSIRDFNINGDVTQFNHILQNYAGSDAVIQRLDSGSYALLTRKPGTNEFVPQTGEDGSIKQYTKDDMTNKFHQVVDSKYRADVTAASSEWNKFLATEKFKSDLKIQEEVAKVQATLFKDLKVEEYKARIEELKNSKDVEVKADTVNGTTLIIPKGQRKFMLVYNPTPPDVPTQDGPMPGPVITAVPFPTVGLAN